MRNWSPNNAVVLFIIAGLIAVYLASYPVFLLNHPISETVYWRSPMWYRPAEWVIVDTPAQSCLLEWSSLVGSRGQTELRCFFFGQGITDPLNEIDIHILSAQPQAGPESH
ncbi:MAG: hypothetical protein DWQ34_07455 [Planctomycetota bacterium]|nr:MAG: hypothetical protein DWQ29_13235 [Planctomycetota bacterium]REJ94896.1 MAG: hypothetical protein DWQ34_07455 [Planctomycetota bacterium]REK27282.1 MAG: hypothetical protein DWQ41_07905 [Planctomycetota bacterium]